MINKLCLFLGTTILLSSLFSLSYASSFAQLAQAETSATATATATDASTAAATAATAASAATEQSEQTQALAAPAPELNKQHERAMANSIVCLPIMTHEQVPLYIRPQQCY